MIPLLLAQAIALPPRPHLSASPVEVAPVVDGALDDAVWGQAPPASKFVTSRPREGEVAKQRTTVRVVYDKSNLYVAVDCDQPDVPVVARLTRRDRRIESDWVAIEIDSKQSKTSAFHFRVNAAGVLLDGLRFNDAEWSADWDEVWDAKTSVRKGGWSAEFKIPFRVLRFAPADEQSWGLQVSRWISGLQELDLWAYVPRATAGTVSHFGRLDHLVQLQPPSAPFEVIPFALGKLTRTDPVSTQLESGYKVTGAIGGDLKWHPTAALTLQATVNPDFAQVEADQNVLNLTTFETYYPEKRPFFLEGLDVFKTPYQLLYTRRVGRAVAAPILAGNEQLVSVPSAAPIYGAVKVTGKLSENWSLGTLQALTAPNSVSVVEPDAVRVNRLVDPMALFGALRLRREFGENGDVGFMATSVAHAERASGYPLVPAGLNSRSGLACPAGTVGRVGSRCFNDAYVGAVDGRWRSPGGDYTGSAQVVASILHDGPTRSVADGTKIRSGDVGAGARASLAKEGGDHWVGAVSADYQTPKFTINDVGYMQRANAANASAEIEYRTLKPVGDTLETHTKFQLQGADNTYGLALNRQAEVTFSTQFSNFWRLFADVGLTTKWFDDRELGTGVALERAGGGFVDTFISSDSSRPVRTMFWAGGVLLSDGGSAYVGTNVIVHAHPQLDLELNPTANLNVGEPRSIGQFTSTGLPMFGRQYAPTASATVRATFTFTPRLSLQAYAQLFLASVHYSDFSYALPAGQHPVVHLSDLQHDPVLPLSNPDYVGSALNLNVVLRWEYRLGSVAYLVYQRAQAPNVTLNPGEVGSINVSQVGRGAATSDALVLKVSYWWG